MPGWAQLSTSVASGRHPEQETSLTWTTTYESRAKSSVPEARPLHCLQMEVPGQRSMRQYQETEEKGRVCHSAPYNKTEVGELLHGLSAVVFETVRDVLTHGGPERCPVVWFAIQCEHKSTTANKDEKANVDESNRTKFTANLLARLLKDFLGHFLKRRLERIQHLGRSFLAVSTWRRCSGCNWFVC